MSAPLVVVHTLYAICVMGLALYGFQALWLSWHYLRNRREDEPLDHAVESWPPVAVHLPIYNEFHVAERVIRASAALDYPLDRLSIRVLDDSDDATLGLVDRVAAELSEQGCDVCVVRRNDRSGYKAGALLHALQGETADFIAIFDADFLPPVDFLRRTLPAFFADGNADVGFVQTRWGHLNRQNSFLTRSQAVALDGHFVVEQAGRQAAGFAFGFNGSGGVWRRECVADAEVGGWQPDTLCEDLDLSYRAQLAGWRGRYLGDVESPAEVPPQLLAFKRQQFRWAKGSIQTLRKLGANVWASDWSIAKRLAAYLHLGAYLLHPLLLLLVILALPLTIAGASPAAPLALLSITSLGPPLLYAMSQRRLYGSNWWRNFVLLPMLMLLGTGICLSNSVAAVQGLFGSDGEFLRTPKFESTANAEVWRISSYRLPLSPIVIAEILLAGYAIVTATLAAFSGNYWTTVFMMLYASGFGLVAGYGLWQAWTVYLVERKRRRDRPGLRKRGSGLWATGATPDR